MQRPSAQPSNAATIEEIMITDIISSICKHILDIKTLSRLCRTNKQFAKYLLSPTGDMHWVKAGKLVCGDEFWYEDDFNPFPDLPVPSFIQEIQNLDGLYRAKIHICPWLSTPRMVKIENRSFHELTTTTSTNENKLLAELRTDKSFLANHGDLETVRIIHRGVFAAVFRLQQTIMDVRFFSMSDKSKQLWHIAVENGKPDMFFASRGDLAFKDLPGESMIYYGPDYRAHKRLLI